MKWIGIPGISLSSCALCGTRGHRGIDICEPCLRDLPRNVNCCRRCALPTSGSETGRLCGRCLRSNPAFDWAISPFLYETPCDHMIKRLKFAEKFYFGRLMGELLATHLHDSYHFVPDLIIPVPLHKSRLRDRGFNQSERIARVLSARLNCPLDNRLLVRTRDTPTQMELPARQRRKNVRGAFEITRPVGGLRVAVVDDVMTTTSTVNEASRVLRIAGATDVHVWTFARAAEHGINRIDSAAVSRQR